MMVPISAVVMAAVHILVASERTETDSDIYANWGTYRQARLHEVARLAWDLCEAVEESKPMKSVDLALPIKTRARHEKN